MSRSARADEFSHAISTGGTSAAWVTACSSISRRQVSGLGSGAITTQPPTAIIPSRPGELIVKLCEIGKTASITEELSMWQMRALSRTEYR